MVRKPQEHWVSKVLTLSKEKYEVKKMIVLGADGLEGDISTPLAIPQRLFSQGVILQRGLNGLLSQSVTFVENGEMRVSSEALTTPRSNEIVGEYTARTCYVYDLEEVDPVSGKKLAADLMPRVENVLDACKRLYYKRFEMKNFTADMSKMKSVDALVETVPQVGREEFIIYMDREDLVIETDLMFKSRQDNEFQSILTSQMQGLKAIPKLKQIGMGLMREGWTKMVRPNQYLRVGPKTVLQIHRTSNQFIKSEWQVQSFYMYVLGKALKDWIGPSIPAMTLEDWVANANVLVSYISGFGDTDRTQNWDTDDIAVSISHVPGMGLTKANRYLWDYVKDVDDYVQYWTICNLLGIISQRAKAAESVFKVKSLLTTNDWMTPKRFQRAMEPNIAGWGSDGTHFMLMPRNNFSFGSKVDVPIPCIVDEIDVQNDQQTLLREANNYEDLLPYDQQSWKDVTIDRGEVPKGAVDSQSMNAQFIRLHATTDARIVEYMDSSTRFIRRLIQWRFPTGHIISNGVDRETRMRLFFWGLFANGERGMKNAYVIEASLDIFKPMYVSYRRARYDAMVVDKKGTDTVGDQIIKPGTIPYAPNLESNTEVVKPIQPSKPMAKTPDAKRVVDLKDGSEMIDDTVVTDVSKHNNPDNPDASTNTTQVGDEKGNEGTSNS